MKKNMNKDRNAGFAQQNAKTTGEMRQQKSFNLAYSHNVNTDNCGFCSKPHANNKCYAFKNAKINDRITMVKKANLCGLCLGKHNINKCNSNFKCLKCEGKHHSSLHTVADVSTAVASCNNCINDCYSHVLLATALVTINRVSVWSSLNPVAFIVIVLLFNLLYILTCTNAALLLSIVNFRYRTYITSV